MRRKMKQVCLCKIQGFCCRRLLSKQLSYIITIVTIAMKWTAIIQKWANFMVIHFLPCYPVVKANYPKILVTKPGCRTTKNGS